MRAALQGDQATTLRRMTARPETVRGQLPVLAVTSGKGGVGKTVLAVNLALRFAATGTRTLLIDLDPGLANVDVHMRLAAPRTVDDILAGRCTAEEAVLVGSRGLMIIPGGNLTGPRADSALARERNGPARLLEAIGPLTSSVDMVILDTGAGIGPWVLGALEACTRALVVTQPDPASCTDAYGVIKISHSLRNDSVPGLAINRVRDKREALLTATRLRKVSKQFLGFEPELFGWLHDQPDVTTSVRNQVPFLLDLPTSHRAVLDLAGIQARLAGRITG